MLTAKGQSTSARNQRGNTLLMGLILLVLLTLMGLASVNTATSNLKVVGNMQYQQEALAAAQVSLNKVLSKGSYFSSPATAPVTDTVDMTGDGTIDYTVALTQPCILSAMDITAAQLLPTIADDLACMVGATLKNPGLMGQATGTAKSDCANVTWRMTATVNDASSKSAVSLTQSARQRMDRILAAAYTTDPAKRCSM